MYARCIYDDIRIYDKLVESMMILLCTLSSPADRDVSKPDPWFYDRCVIHSLDTKRILR